MISDSPGFSRPRFVSRLILPALFALLALPALAEPVAAQEDSVLVAAGPRYSSGAAGRAFGGTNYRDLWTTPIRVPVLRPDTFAGGLTLEQRGTGLQTLSLRFAAPDGREFVFRSVDKEQRNGLHPDLRGTLVEKIVQDQISGKHPAAALVVAPLLEAAGVLHATPRLAVMADLPMLGEHRAEFANRLGLIEIRPDESDDGDVEFAGYPRVIGTERLLERLEESAEDRVDVEAYARARLMDVLVGDWDRHMDQWRWAEDERGGVRYWLAIPRDRDNAFFRTGGFIGAIAGAFRPTARHFRPEYTELEALIHNAQGLDRRFLSALTWADWERIATDLRRRLTDAVITNAVAAMPVEYHPLNAEVLAGVLRGRRDGLITVARQMYDLFSPEVDIYATDEDNTAVVERLPSGNVRVVIRGQERDDAPFYDRELVSGETREVRLSMRGGEDVVVIRGTPGPIKVRLLGDGGDDVLMDSISSGRSGETVFYDDRGDNQFVRLPGTRLDTREFDLPEVAGIAENNAPPPRDWGGTFSLFSPTAGWVSNAGPVLGGGPSWTRYGFRRHPYASKAGVSFLVAPLHGRVGIEAASRYLRTGGGGETRTTLRATQISVMRFSGFGNDSPLIDSSEARLWSTEFGGSIEVVKDLGGGAHLSAGPLASHFDGEPRDGTPAQLFAPPGTGEAGAAGLRLAGELDARDSAVYPRLGAYIQASGSGFPVAWGDNDEPFGRAEVSGSAYLPLPFPLEATLALRAGGERVWKNAPLQYLASVGGGSSLRGYPSGRFVGDASAFGGAELRIKAGRANLLVARGDIGFFALGDAGRVWWQDEESDTWHTGYGGGIWFGPLGRTMTAHALWAYGESHTLSAGIGMPF